MTMSTLLLFLFFVPLYAEMSMVSIQGRALLSLLIREVGLSYVTAKILCSTGFPPPPICKIRFKVLGLFCGLSGLFSTGRFVMSMPFLMFEDC